MSKSKSEIKRLKAIIARQAEIQTKARIRRNLRRLNLAAKKAQSPAPKLQKGRRVKDRHLIQMVLGSLSDRWVATYNAAGYTKADVEQMIRNRPAVLEKLKALGEMMEVSNG